MKINTRRVYLNASTAAVLAMAACNFVRADDLLTPDVTRALNAQWATPLGAENAIRALEAYGTGKNPTGALTILVAGQTNAVQELYGIAAGSLKKDFWTLVAGSHEGFPSCDAVSPMLVLHYAAKKTSLADAAKAYRDKGEFVGLAVLLKASPLTSPAPPPPPAPPPAVPLPATRAAAQMIYRACFSVSPQALFKAIEETIAIKP
jgi:hypothetical protein